MTASLVKSSKEHQGQKLTGLPHTKHAEQAVIGTILTTPSSVHGILDKLHENYFFEPANKYIVEAILELTHENKPPDLHLVYEKLREQGNNLKVGDLEGLSRYLDFNVQPESISYWLDEVKKYWELRLIIETCHAIVEKAKNVVGANITDFLQYAEQAFIRLSDSRVNLGLKSASEIVKETVLSLEELIKNPGKVTGIPSGFIDLDKITAGFQPSDLIILAGRPAMGKTGLALNIAAHAIFQYKKRVAFFSLEMSNQQIMQRILSTMAKIESHKFRNGKMTSDDLERLYPQVSSLQHDNLLIDDTPALSITELSSRCRKVKREKGNLDLIIIDYLQLMTVFNAQKNQSREREISIISTGLKALAKELSCPVIALAQLNRGLEQRPDKRPRPSDLRESGSIEQDADLILFIYRDEVYNKETQEKGIAEVIIGKNRHGPIDTVKLAFQSNYTSFHNLAKFDEHDEDF